MLKILLLATGVLSSLAGVLLCNNIATAAGIFFVLLASCIDDDANSPPAYL